MHEFSVEGIFADGAAVGAGLVVEHDDFGAGGELLEIAEGGGLGGDIAAEHAEPEAIFSAGVAGDAVVEVPLFDAAGVGPVDPLAEGGVVPVVFGGEILGGEFFEAGDAVLAVADAVAVIAGPVVVGEAFQGGSG